MRSLSCVYNCDDLSLNKFIIASAVQIYEFSYIHYQYLLLLLRERSKGDA